MESFEFKFDNDDEASASPDADSIKYGKYGQKYVDWDYVDKHGQPEGYKLGRHIPENFGEWRELRDEQIRFFVHDQAGIVTEADLMGNPDPYAYRAGILRNKIWNFYEQPMKPWEIEVVFDEHLKAYRKAISGKSKDINLEKACVGLRNMVTAVEFFNEYAEGLGGLPFEKSEINTKAIISREVSRIDRLRKGPLGWRDKSNGKYDVPLMHLGIGALVGDNLGLAEKISQKISEPIFRLRLMRGIIDHKIRLGQNKVSAKRFELKNIEEKRDQKVQDLRKELIAARRSGSDRSEELGEAFSKRLQEVWALADSRPENQAILAKIEKQYDVSSEVRQARALFEKSRGRQAPESWTGIYGADRAAVSLDEEEWEKWIEYQENGWTHWAEELNERIESDGTPHFDSVLNDK